MHTFGGTTHTGYVVSSTNQMFLNFMSDGSYNYKGYKVLYREVKSKFIT